VVLELGLFLGVLGRRRVAVLYREASVGPEVLVVFKNQPHALDAQLIRRLPERPRLRSALERRLSIRTVEALDLTTY
jgi:hypothetical protein